MLSTDRCQTEKTTPLAPIEILVNIVPKMQCPVCRSEVLSLAFRYQEPDKYEEWCGIKKVERSWWRCLHCDHGMSHRVYDPQQLMPIYLDGYRDKGFRKETIEETFAKVKALPPNESETAYRGEVYTIGGIFDEQKVLDIGSGLGIWPHWLARFENEVTCIEPNRESAKFIRENLGLTCYDETFDEFYEHREGRSIEPYDVISAVHVLEHMPNPKEFLYKCQSLLDPKGQLFIEVPDAQEFRYLPKEHDEFNSCHLHFFSVGSLYRVLMDCGFNVKWIHRAFYEKRNLSRIMAICDVR